MDSLLWWTILVILILLITVLSLYLFYNLVREHCVASKTNARATRTPQRPQKPKLSKYKFGRTDVEDLTSIEKDFSNLLPRVEFVNEVETPKSSVPTTPRGSQRRKASLLPDIHESNFSFASLYSVQDIMSGMSGDREERRGSELSPRRYSLVTEGMRRNSLATLPRKYSLMPDNVNSTDTLDCLDPIAVETKRAISNVEEDVRKVDFEIDYYIGGTKNLKFYEINEKLIRLNIALSDIECGSAELRQRKREVQAYITDCKEKLKSKV